MNAQLRSDAFGALHAVRLLRAAGGELYEQALLHGQLARIEFDLESERLMSMLAIMLIGFSLWLCTLLFAGVLVMAATWDTALRVPAAAGLLLLFGMGTGLAWQRYRSLSTQGSQGFRDSRQELAADAALLRSSI